jgi:hypothetical protein
MAPATPLPKWGGLATPFLAPTAGLGVVEPPPCTRGWSTPKRPKKKKKKGIRLLGVAGPPSRAWGWLWQPVWGGQSHPRPLWGGPATLKSPIPFFFFFFLAFWGWSNHPQISHGSHPRFSSLFFFFFSIFTFLKKKIKKINGQNYFVLG